MTGRALRVLPALLAGLLVLPACAAADETPERADDGFPLTVQDCDREFTIEQRPERILTMGSTASTLMWAAGATGAITTRAFESVSDLGPAQAALEGVPLISNDNDLTLEVILGQDPDLVITYGLNLTTQADLAAAGIDSIVNSGFCDGDGSGPADGPVTFEDDVFPDIELYGRIAGTEEAAEQKVAELRRRVAAVAEQPRNPEIITAAAIGLNGTNLRAYGVASLTHQQIETLGLTDVFGDIPERLADVSVEEFIARDPDVVILLSGGGGVEKQPLETLRGLAEVAGVTAIRENRIIPLESPYLLGGPLGVDGLEAMAEAVSGYR
ncbi:MAG: ABC transporter substrate-binding protein [Pseudonocardiaceae bacterium]